MGLRVAVAGLAGALLIAGPAWAGHHRWDISEAFYASDSIQFVELVSLNDGEAGLGPFSLTSTSGGSLSFVTNLPSAATANTWVLCATAGFAALPGAPPPDYVLPDGFLDPAGDTVNYAGVDIVAFPAFPTDGVTSLSDSGTPGMNTPRNFAGVSGSVNAALAVPTLPAWAIIGLVGMALLLASGLLRRSSPQQG